MKNLLRKLPKIQIREGIYKTLPESPGVYIFLSSGVPIYVGKAINLKKRVSSYFQINLETKTKKMISEAEEISYIIVFSELEALLLEAKLIKSFLPKYNIAAKDDKHPLYILITGDTYPQIKTARKIDIKANHKDSIYGPFPSSGIVKSVLKMIRRVFPYSDHKLGKRACLYSQIGLCDPCPNQIANIQNTELKEELTKKYRSNIAHIKAILDGRISSVQKSLVKKMNMMSKNENFEEAAELLKKIKDLEYVINPVRQIDSYIENPNLAEDVKTRELKDLKKLLESKKLHISSLKRIECFDVAHLQGTNATASMVVFINGNPEKKYYRHFKIRQKNGWDDYKSLQEVAKRRRNHFNDWGRPDLIVVDGGKGQLSMLLKEFNDEIFPIIGIAKRFNDLVIPTKSLNTTILTNFRIGKRPALNLITRMRDEAHRFARVYHHKLVKSSLFETNL